MVGEHTGARVALHGVEQQFLKVVAVVDVVAQHQGAQVVADELFADQEGLGQAVR
ncbi:hypothetical protein D3C76_1859980 [compost metagenome]